MSDRASALSDAKSSGVVSVAEAGLVGMLTLRGSLEDAAFQAAVKTALGTGIPAPRQFLSEGARSLLWMSPDELLVVCGHGEAETLAEALSEALGEQHHLVVNVSDARAVFTLTGDDGAMRDTLAKLTPADLRPASLPVEEVRRTRLAQVPAAIWIESEGQAKVVCFRSVAAYVFGLLKQASRRGSEVDFFGNGGKT